MRKCDVNALRGACTPSSTERRKTYSWPAVSQSCSRTVRSSRYMVLERKSIPIVACALCCVWYDESETGRAFPAQPCRVSISAGPNDIDEAHLVVLLEGVVHEARDDGGLAHALVAQKHCLSLGGWGLGSVSSC